MLMNHEPNTVTWNIGDLVLHDCDAKRPEMLMRVKEYLPDGHVRAEYIDARKRKLQRSRAKSGSGWFELFDLHDPARFGVLVIEGE